MNQQAVLVLHYDAILVLRLRADRGVVRSFRGVGIASGSESRHLLFTPLER